MAKKTINKKVDDTKPSYWALFKAFFTNERTRFITGLVCAIVTIYIGLALISFFFTGAADQSKIENVPVTDLLTNQGSVENWTGARCFPGRSVDESLVWYFFFYDSVLLGFGWSQADEH